MTSLNREGGPYNQNPYNLQVKEWEDQFNNLNKMLDQYTLQTNGTGNLPEENKGASQPNVNPFERSASTKDSQYTYTPSQKVDSKKLTANFKKVEAPAKKKSRPVPSQGRKVPSEKHTHTRGQKSTKGIESPKFQASPGKSPLKVFQEASPSDVNFPSEPHTSYGPRNRAPYGQAFSPPKSPEQKNKKLKLQSSPVVQSKPQNTAKTKTNPQKKPNPSGAPPKNPATSRKNLHQKNPSLNINVGGDSFQQHYWANVPNPYSRQGAQTSRANTSRGEDASARVESRLASPREYQNYGKRIESSNLSPIPKNWSGNKFPLHPGAINSISPNQRNLSPVRNSAGSLSLSIGSRSITRKKSVEDLVGENLLKLEQSVILDKKAEERAMSVDVGQNTELVPNTQSSGVRAFGANQLGQRSTNTSNRKGDLNYQIVVEQYSDGTRYEGEKVANRKHGRGFFFYKEGYKYDGHWEDDVMTGFGTLWFDENIKIYEGDWQNNVFHGRGSIYNHQPISKPEFKGTDFRELKTNWAKFEGQFEAGVKEGLGTLSIANGDVFVGDFRRDVVHGRGSYSTKDGNTFIGLWKENILIQKF